MSEDDESIESPIAFKSPHNLSSVLEFEEELSMQSPIIDKSISRSSSPFIAHPQSPLKSQDDLLPTNISPWRQFRSINPSTIPSTAQSSIFHNKPNLTPDTNNVFIDTTSKEDELNKRIINYKIQIKLMKNFLQELIEKNNIDPKEIKSIMPLGEIKDASTISLEKELNDLREEYDEIFKLNEDLFTNLQNFEEQIEIKDQQLQESEKIRDLILQIAKSNGIDSNLPIDLQLKSIFERKSQNSILTPPESDDGKDQELNKLEIENLNLNKQLEFKDEELKELKRKLEENSPSPKQSNDKSQKDDDQDIKNETQDFLEILNIKDMEISALRSKLIKETESLEKLKQKEIDDSQTTLRNNSNSDRELKQALANNEELTIQLQNQTNKVHELNSKLAAKDNNDKSESNETKLSQDHLLIITSLEKENQNIVQELKSLKLQESTLMTEYLDLQNAYSKILEELNATQDSYSLLKQTEDNKLSEIKTQQTTINKLQLDLEQAINLQRKNHSEKIQTSYKNESLQKDNESLKSKIQKLTEFIDFSNNNQDTIKKLSIIEFQYKDLITFDMNEFSKLLKSFNKIAEDESILNPTKKYERIMRKLSNFEISNEKDITFIRENHSSIFNYFVRATDMIINNHVKLLLNENEQIIKRQNLALIEKNSKLIKEIEELKKEGNIGNDSITELRFNDIRRRWKSERERRIFEDSEAQKKFRELEDEIARK
ncbi:uncharacterized protein KGF55_005072 [Candida pseudojiufengensis]|uniref:uncharacterized protein n=1 Tax=Candida pseudojiufengensis TaxID=497109 RepID=UPI00222408E9|nr:uncharacterized protein KGF55_005072 [Candida pseudojiufengensis]KAI5959840.1 hypothetical protein KGF55_005072 [Candida pseudojiufengensis]